MSTEVLLGAYILMLAIWVGNEVISKVPTTLHTPLMSGANAIHGIIVVGGFVVTDRMLQMFKARPRPAKPAEKK